MADQIEITVRPFRKQDAEQVAKIAIRSLPEPWSWKDYLALEENPLARTFVAETQGDLAGFSFLYLVGEEGQIMEIATAKAHRRKGVAKALLQEMVRTSKEEGAVRFTLEVRASNAPAIALYRSFGFYEVGRRKGYYRNPKEDAVLMDREAALSE